MSVPSPQPTTTTSSSSSSALTALFTDLETRFQSTTLDPHRWYILAMATLVASPDPETAQQLYLHLIQQAEYTSSGSRQALVRRLRETLVKCVPIVGVCKPLEAILAIGAVERDEDKDYTSTRPGWQCDQANHDRGADWLGKIYTRNLEGTMDLFAAHKDFAWISHEITYGLYLSDRQVLDDLDTQLVVLPAIMSQNLRKETHWHIRGTRRIGVSQADVQIICDCVRRVAGHFGVVLDRVPSVEEVEGDV
ncbi:hypothetical protein ASPZODRAFT_134108 [Penicilliopsis zonata CBS 506.65]|uniref:Carboxymuconolactone decarboxylase-like domain-containing protein n=1 Tax=Penicilliopsis zonata CBS 506.65 TaxID=1073090 RepID=A0A1L9SEH9_9EURO|nr:hypothetical protein ASPZODRAFT_134108 [Penicilliopsis zonata CBS 506.65]OJJ45454.1 hypothetical protein ASPZODRAFT_134108 [Penicilliopsis zonata CBS 506.65]